MSSLRPTLKWSAGIKRVDIFFNRVYEKENVDRFLRNYTRKQK